MTEGVSTYVYRVRHGAELFYLRVLPESGEGFGPEAQVMETLRARGVRVPRVLYVDACDEMLQRSVMLTSAVEGQHLGHLAVDEMTRQILVEAGRDLAAINSLAVDGFGWIRRDPDRSARLQAAHATLGAFAGHYGLTSIPRDLALLSQ